MPAFLRHCWLIASAAALACAGCGSGQDGNTYHPPAGDSDPKQVTSCFDDPAKVVAILDGDTIDVVMKDPDSGEPIEERVRLTGVQAPEIEHPPEPAEPCGDAARHYAEATVGTRVELVFDTRCADDPLVKCRDDYQRLLAYVKLADCTDLGARLIQNGLARLFLRDEFDREESYQALFDAAKQSGIGIHGAGCPE